MFIMALVFVEVNCLNYSKLILTTSDWTEYKHNEMFKMLGNYHYIQRSVANGTFQVVRYLLL